MGFQGIRYVLGIPGNAQLSQMVPMLKDHVFLWFSSQSLTLNPVGLLDLEFTCWQVMLVIQVWGDQYLKTKQQLAGHGRPVVDV